MRADRLVATLLLLQTRGRLTAAQVAHELEVSERTARRDLEALNTAGVPVYSAQGRGGGWTLVGGARTNLSGLTSDEARALFLVAGPAGTATPQVRAALRKLLQALPPPLRDGAEAAGAALVVEGSSWGRAAPKPPPHLAALQRAVLDAEQVRLGYAGRAKPASERVVSPLGLVDKAGVWYLVAGTDAGVRTFRVGRVTAVAGTGERVVRPQGFDLAAAWQRSAAEVEQRRGSTSVQALADPRLLPYLRSMLGTRLVEPERDSASARSAPAGSDRSGTPVGDDHSGTPVGGRVPVTVTGPSVAMIAAQLAGFGTGLELTGPPQARAESTRIARELLALYGDADKTVQTER